MDRATAMQADDPARRRPDWRDSFFGYLRGDRPAELEPLGALFRSANLYLLLELAAILVWAAQLFAFVFALDTPVGRDYVDGNKQLLGHLAVVLALVTVLQQIRASDPISWWIAISLFSGAAIDAVSLIEVLTPRRPRTVGWAYAWLLGLTVTYVALSVYAVAWYVYWVYYRQPTALPPVTTPPLVEAKRGDPIFKAPERRPLLVSSVAIRHVH